MVYVQSQLAVVQFLHRRPVEGFAPSPAKVSIHNSPRSKHGTHSALHLMHQGLELGVITTTYLFSVCTDHML